MFVLFFTACGGGSSESPNTDNNISDSDEQYSVEIDTSQVLVQLFRPDEGFNKGLDEAVLVSWVGEGLIVGYAPGVAQPSWLQVSESTDPQENGGVSTVTLSIDLGSLVVGIHETSLRFVSGSVDNNVEVHRDLPIIVEILDSPTFPTDEILLTSSNLDSFIPDSQSIFLDTSAYPGMTWTVEYENTNSLQHVWLDLQKRNDQLDVSPNRLLPVGQYTADIIVNYQQRGFTGRHIMALRYLVEAVASELNFVTPAVYEVGDTTPLHLSGYVLSSIEEQQISIQDMDIQSVEVISDQELVIHHNGFSSNGVKNVEINLSDGRFLTHQVLVKEYMAFSGLERVDMSEWDQDLNNVKTITYHELSDAFLLNVELGEHPNLYNEIWRISKENGEWSVTAKADADFKILSADMKSIISNESNRLIFRDAITLQVQEDLTLPLVTEAEKENGDSGNIGVVGVLNNGEILLSVGVSIPDSNFRGMFSIYDSLNRTYKRSDYHNHGMLKAFDRTASKIALIPNRDEVPNGTYRGFYKAAKRSFLTEKTNLTYYGGYRKLCPKGSDLFLNGVLYDKDFALLAEADHGLTNVEFNASNDCDVFFGVGRDSSSNSISDVIYSFDFAAGGTVSATEHLRLEYNTGVLNNLRLYNSDFNYISPNGDFSIFLSDDYIVQFIEMDAGTIYPPGGLE